MQETLHFDPPRQVTSAHAPAPEHVIVQVQPDGQSMLPQLDAELHIVVQVFAV
jgi:hypothetical protein